MEKLENRLDEILEFRNREAIYPRDHRPGMRVPFGGSSCANCEYLSVDRTRCNNHYFQRWHGTDLLPFPADQYCSDWYSPEKIYLTDELRRREFPN